MQTWFALEVVPRREEGAAAWLNRRGFEVYVPMLRAWRASNRYTKHKKTLHRYCIMPGYVFLGVAGHPPWHRIRAARFVYGVVSFNGEPASIPLVDGRAMREGSKGGRSGIEDLRRREEGGEFTAFDPARRMPSGLEYNVGSDVLVTTGPLAGQRAKVMELGADTARVLMTGLGREVLVRCGLEVLEAVDDDGLSGRARPPSG